VNGFGVFSIENHMERGQRESVIPGLPYLRNLTATEPVGIVSPIRGRPTKADLLPDRRERKKHGLPK
jgi:hypothetical protein